LATKVLILGDPGGVGEALALRLRQLGAEADTVTGGQDAELAVTLAEPEWTAIAVVTHDDALALRLTLLGAHLRPELPLWVTLFDRTIAHQLRQIVPSVNIVATAEVAARELARHCTGLIEHPRTGIFTGVRIVDDSLRLMVIAGVGLFAALVLQTTITMIALHDGLADALYFSTRLLATVTDVPRSGSAATWFKLVSVVVTVISVVLVAVFTAALVRRLGGPRLTALFGRRRAAARGHVLLVGFGQIGFRLAQELQYQHIPVVALDSDAEAPCVRLARGAGVPVAIGRGDDREMLELLGVGGCALVAAVTSDDLANVAIGLAASDVRPDIPVVLRLGDGNVAAETQSLLHLGHVCDIHDLVARMLADALLADGTGVTADGSS